MKQTKTLIIIACATSLALGVALNGYSPDRQQTNSDSEKIDQADQRIAEKPPYHTGMITVKPIGGLDEFTKQAGHVSFNLPSLDLLADDFEITLLEKRYKYNPSKLKQGMPDLSRIYRIEFPDRYTVAEVVDAFNKNPNIEYAEPILVYSFDDIPDDIMYAQCQHLPQIMAEEAWEMHHGEDGEEVIVAIIDTGTDWLHPDLTENTWQNMGEDADGDGVTLEFDGTEWVRDPDDLNGIDDDNNGFVDDVIGWDFHEEVTLGNGSNPDPLWGQGPYEHGTHCSGIAAGRTNNEIGISSVSWNIKYMPVQTDAGNNTVIYGFDGIIYAAENGADVISNSWGGLGYSQGDAEVIDYAMQLGSIVVASAGNSNLLEYRYPASYPGVISVASVSVDDTKAGYSTYGQGVDISAPGGGWEGGILSTMPNNTYDYGSGTSMAGPMVAGCLGFLKSYQPQWTNEQLITQLLGTTDSINSINPGYENLLGTGRVNAFQMLDEDNVVMPQVLKLGITDSYQEDENGNDINEAGEEVYLNFEFRNFIPFIGEDDVEITLLCNDPDIEILEGSATVNIPPDNFFTVENLFQIKVSEEAQSHFVTITIHFESSIPVVYGQDMEIHILVAPSGIFVFDGEYNKRDYSGSFITSTLERLGYDVTYSNVYPTTLKGFETVFTSHGNRGASWTAGYRIMEEHALLFQDFLENGGNLYVEMDRMFTRMYNQGYSSYAPLKQLFGVMGHESPAIQNLVDSLYGFENTPFEGISFTESNQLHNWRMEKPTAMAGAVIPFAEYGYGNVAIMNDGASTFGHKTFYFTYSLAELIDNSTANSRINVLLKIIEFFGYELPEAYVLSNFTADKTIGSPPLTVQFSDISLSDTGYQVSSWEWDFDNDGVIDSYDQQPEWTYDEGGSYDVMLIVSNGLNSDTLVAEEYITLNHGFLVFEGIAGGSCNSGSFINDYLSDIGYPHTYTTSFPASFEGFDAAFLSFGNYGINYTAVTDDMAEVISQYIVNGGYVYIEGADVMGFDQNNSAFNGLFGLASTADGTTNYIDSLVGQADALTEGMLFTYSTQPAVVYIDIYNPLPEAQTAFTENNYGTVAVQYTGDYDQRTFCFSYALAELVDAEYPNTRVELLNRICNFFDVNTSTPRIQIGQELELKVYPNPCSGATHVELVICDRRIVTCELYTISGIKIKELLNEEMAPGTYKMEVDLTEFPVGIYYCVLRTGSGTTTNKLIKL